jgi:hypothetical protein
MHGVGVEDSGLLCFYDTNVSDSIHPKAQSLGFMQEPLLGSLYLNRVKKDSGSAAPAGGLSNSNGQADPRPCINNIMLHVTAIRL